MAFERVNLGLAIIGLVVGVAGLGYAVNSDIITTMVGRKDRFSCELYPDTDKGGEIWTVMYRKDNQKSQPWLKMVTTLGGNWTPLERCQEIARKLELYREDGLIKLDYRSDPNITNQKVICAYTKKNGENCHLVITLKPNADGYETLREMTTALHGGDGIYQNSDGTNVQISSQSPAINLSNFLSKEDR